MYELVVPISRFSTPSHAYSMKRRRGTYVDANEDKSCDTQQKLASFWPLGKYCKYNIAIHPLSRGNWISSRVEHLK